MAAPWHRTYADVQCCSLKFLVFREHTCFAVVSDEIVRISYSGPLFTFEAVPLSKRHAQDEASAIIQGPVFTPEHTFKT